MLVRRMAGALVAVLAVGAVAALTADAAPRKSCAALKGKRLKGKGRVRVVVQQKKIEGELEPVAYVCGSPNGRAWPVSPGDPVNEGLEFAQISLATSAGNWVAVRLLGSVGIGYAEVGKAINARTGESFSYWRVAGGPGPEAESQEIEHLQLNERGQLAYAVGIAVKPEERLVTRRIVAVESGGKRRVLDSAPAEQIPSSSLKLSGSTVQWTDAGVARSAAL
jgi:hypothetical protein